jgi:hypothetical protein
MIPAVHPDSKLTTAIIIPRSPPAPINVGGKLVNFDNEPSIPAATITRSGLEIPSILPPVAQTPELPEAIKTYLEDQGWNGVTLELLHQKGSEPS